VHPHVEEQPAEADERPQLAHEHEQPRQDERQQEMGPAHGRGGEELQQLLRPELDHGEADPPQAAPHQVEAHQPGDQEVDVARAGLDHALLAGGGDVAPAQGPLQGVVGGQAGVAALAPGGIVAEGPLRRAVRRRRTGRHDHQVHAAGAQGPAGFGLIERRHRQPGRLPQQLQQSGRARGIRLHRHAERLRRLGAEGDPQRQRQQHREDKHPEHRLRLPDELQDPGAGELHQRMEPAAGAGRGVGGLSHRAAPGR